MFFVIMKKMIGRTSVLLAFVLLFLSCSNDIDDSIEISNKTVTGYWLSVTSHECVINLNSGKRKDFEEKPNGSLSFKLYEDGTCIKGSLKGEYKLLGHELDMFLTYIVNENMKSIERSVIDVYVIEDITPDKMVISYITARGYSSEENTGEECRIVYTMKRINY